MIEQYNKITEKVSHTYLILYQIDLKFHAKIQYYNFGNLSIIDEKITTFLNLNNINF